MDEQRCADKVGRLKAFDVGEQVIDLNTALLQFFFSKGYSKLDISGALESLETSKWIQGLYEWTCEGKTIETIRLTGDVIELLIRKQTRVEF
jgi:hypothetical protein